MATLRAEGLSMREIGRALRMPHETVRNTLSLPETQTEVARRRAILKMLTSEAVGRIAGEAWDLTAGCVATGDPDGFDKMTRGLAAMEKISASVSGESQKVEHSGTVQTPGNLDGLKALIALVRAIPVPAEVIDAG